MTLQRELPSLFGRYKLERMLGQGGMGTVFLAIDSILERHVAIKIPHFAESDYPEAAMRFYREARAAASIEHPNICGIYDVGEIEDIYYIAMPYIEGHPLSDRIGTGHSWELGQAVELVHKIAIAVDFLHERDIIHRDLKPQNIIIRPNGEPVVMDFGLARSAHPSLHITRTGDIVGTPAYMAPEQVQGDRDIGPIADVYSLGVILYQLITGELPFNGPGHAIYGQILHAQPHLPSKFRPSIDPILESVCMKALSKSRESRYSAMKDLAQELRQYISIDDRIKFDAAQCQLYIAAGKNSKLYILDRYRDYFQIWKRYAEQGMAESQWLYGDCLLEGVGTSRDIEGAAHWFLKSAEQGYALAQMSLANRYYKGEGVAKDLEKAIAWYQKAAGQGEMTAKRALRHIKKVHSGSKGSLPTSRKPWWKFWE